MNVNSLAESLLFVTTRIETLKHNGETGSGTGFFFSHKYKGNEYSFIVTNRHVVENAVKSSVTFIEKENDNPKLGHSITVQTDNTFKWIGSNEEDIAIIPLQNFILHIRQHYHKEIYFRNISSDHIPNINQVLELDAIEDIIFVGYPNGIWDNINYIPVIRKGITATPYSINFEGKRKFLIDASVFGGSSGSPVFMYNAGARPSKGGGMTMGTHIYFLGIVTAVFFRESQGNIVSLPIPTEKREISIGKEMIDLGVVIKPSVIVEFIETLINNQG